MHAIKVPAVGRLHLAESRDDRKDHAAALKREGEETCQNGAWAACCATWGEQMDAMTELVPSSD